MTDGRLTKLSVNSSVAQDRDWMECAIAEYEQPLLRYVQMFVKNAETARDIVQNTFMKMCEQQQPLESSQLKLWLFKVSRNGAIDVYRKERRMAGTELETNEVVGSRQAGPADLVERQDTHSAVMDEIATLSANQQEVLRLRFQSEFSYQEIADVTGLTKSNVGVLLHTAIKTLQVQFDA